jgi:hypothetical protein
MKSGLILGLSLGLMWFPYAAFIPGPAAGNPDQTPYNGQPDGVYDIAANPPKINGTVTYNPYAPLPPAPANTLGTNGSASGTLPPMAPPPPR